MKVKDNIATKSDTPIPITIAGEDRPTYLCNFCNQVTTKLTDYSGQNTTQWCKHCAVEFQPEDMRRNNKISTPQRNKETLVSQTPGISYEDIQIHKAVEVKGGLAEMKRRGLRVTNYKEGIG
jgi:hypothetical protein